MFELNNSIRDYHWGSRQQISDLLGLQTEVTPQAELWIGAHPACPSRVVGSSQGLDELIAADPQSLLGEDVSRRYGRLPFLFKVLSAAQPLSIQVHPTLEQARERFAGENAAGVPLDAPERNYRDDNHKPEMLYALTDFVALSGFREPRDIIADLTELGAALSAPNRGTLAALVTVLEGPDPLASALEFVLGPHQEIGGLVTELCQQIAATPILRDTSRFAELVRINSVYPADAGVLVALLLNLVSLRPGQAISLAAGNVHAYLRGLGIEVMANSDNVLRGGLTTKHIDVAELLDVTRALPSPAPLLRPEQLGTDDLLFRPDFDEFQLQVFAPEPTDAHTTLQLHGAGVVLCTAGSFSLQSRSTEYTLIRGQSLFLEATDLPVTARSLAPNGQLFAASAQEGSHTEQ